MRTAFRRELKHSVYHYPRWFFTQVRFIDWIRQIVRQIVCVCGENNVRHVDTISSPTCSTTCCTTNRTVCGPLKKQNIETWRLAEFIFMSVSIKNSLFLCYNLIKIASKIGNAAVSVMWCINKEWRGTNMITLDIHSKPVSHSWRTLLMSNS
jgi:hypothetical protein